MSLFQRAIRITTLVIACALAITPATSLHAQVSRADSATVLLQAAEQLRLAGAYGLARDILQFVAREYWSTAQGQRAIVLLEELYGIDERGSGATGLTLWNTLYGAWLGAAVPAAFGTDSERAIGAGLLIGSMVGFGATRAITSSHPVTSGQAITTAFGSWWGTFQGMGWREVFDIGSTNEILCCGANGESFEIEVDSDNAPFTAAVIGGLTGLFTAAALANRLDPTAGSAWYVNWGALWGTWYGVVAQVLADPRDDDVRLAVTLIGGNVGLIATALTAKSARLSSGRVWLISAAGLAGGFAGLGLTLVAGVDDSQTGILITALGSTAGLIAGALTTKSARYNIGAGQLGANSALFNHQNNEWSLGLPLPQPTLLSNIDARGRKHIELGMRLSLFKGKF